MIDWFKENFMFVAAIFGGTIISVITSEKHSLLISLTRVLSGVFCALFFTEPLVDLLSLNPDKYSNATAGLLSMSGYSLTQIVVTLNKDKIIGIVKAWRGK